MPTNNVFLRQIISVLEGDVTATPYPTVTDNVALRMILNLLIAAAEGGGGGGGGFSIPNNTLAGNTSGVAGVPTGLTPSAVKLLLSYTAQDVGALPGRTFSFIPNTADWYRLVDETAANGQGGAYLVLTGPGASGAAPWMTILAFQGNSQNLGNFGNAVNMILSTQGSPIDIARVNNDTSNNQHYAFDVHFNTATPGTVNVSLFQTPDGNPITAPVANPTNLGDGQYLNVLPGGFRTTGLGIFGSLVAGEYFQVGASAGQIFCNNTTNVPGNPNGTYVGNPGDVFMWHGATSGKTFWVKDSGTGNTGWIPVALMVQGAVTGASPGALGLLGFDGAGNFCAHNGTNWQQYVGDNLP